MEILPNIEIVDLALCFGSTLVIADIHIGYEEALNKQGILVPRLQFKEMVKRMESIFTLLKNKSIKKIIVNGDLKHEFGTISEQEWRNTLKFIDLLAKHCKEVVLIKGNHDTILGPIARKSDVKVVEHYVIESTTKKSSQMRVSSLRTRSQLTEKISILKKSFKKITKQPKSRILITHGNKIPNKEVLKEVSTIIIGHEHPAVSIREGPRVEQFKCFLKGKYKSRNLIVQPSFNSMIEGTDILREQILSPFLQQNMDNFDVYVVEDKVYEFGKLKGLKKN